MGTAAATPASIERRPGSSLEGYELSARHNSNEKFGAICIYRNAQTDSVVWVKNVAFEEDELQNYVGKYIREKSYLMPNYCTEFVEALGEAETSSFGMCKACGSISNFVVGFRPPFRDLSVEITTRVSERSGADFFEESEIWYVLEQIVKLEMQISASNRKVHGNLSIGSILLDQDGKRLLTQATYCSSIQYCAFRERPTIAEV